jgi:hypothetical protein
MKRVHHLFVLTLVISLVSAVALHAEDPAVPARDSGPADGTQLAQPEPATALAVQIADIRLAAGEELDALQARLTAAAPGSELAHEIELQIVQQKIDTEAAILGAIIEDARAQGDEARATEAEGALDRLLNPEKYRPEPIPVDRPAPPTR